MKNNHISAQGTLLSIKQQDKNDFISLTDIARAKNVDEPKDVVKNWMRSRTTIEFLGLWERINNPDFKEVEFDSFRSEAGRNSIKKIQESFVYANEADVLNVALFGMATFISLDQLMNDPQVHTHVKCYFMQEHT